MRVTNNMTSYGFLRSLNKSQEREYAIQEQLSDGKAIHRPSDDPVKTVRSLRFNTNLSMNEQFTQNLQDAQSWMDNTDGAMSDLSSIMSKVNELVISADDTKTTTDLNTIGKQIDEMINQIVSIGNTKIGDRYIFAGQNDATQPFVRTTITDPNSNKTQEVVVYNGDSNKISMPIQAGAANPNQDSINLTGADVFGPVTNVYGKQTVSVLNRLLEIKSELGKTSAISQTNSAGGIGAVGGTYTLPGFATFDVRVDNVTGGQVDAASYSNDGGNTWIAVGGAGTSITAGDPSVINLPNGVNFSVTASAGNAAKDVYSFRVPQTPAIVSQSNTTGGAATVTGVYTGSGITSYTLKITGKDALGQITGADYSTDGGATWGAVTSLVTGSPSTLSLPNGVSLNIASTVNNTVDDTYSFKLPQGKGADAKWLSNVATQTVQDDHDMQLKAQTQLGTRMAMYEMAANVMQNQNLTITTDLANNEDIDMAKAITDFNTSKTVYEAALSVGAKIMTKSLVDYI